MDKTELLDIFTRRQRIEVNYPGIKREVGGSVIRHISLPGGTGFVIYSRLDEDTAGAAIDALGGAGRLPSALREETPARGWRAGARMLREGAAIV